MSDPVTIGAMSSLVLSMASEAVVKGVVGEVVKDAYTALKHKIAHWAAGDVDALEKNPKSAARQAVIAEAIDQRPDDEKLAIKRLTIALTEALKNDPPQGPVGIEFLGKLEAARIGLEGISVHQGKGIIFKEDVKTPGEFELKNMTVGDTPGKAAQ